VFLYSFNPCESWSKGLVFLKSPEGTLTPELTRWFSVRAGKLTLMLMRAHSRVLLTRDPKDASPLQ
jgi:hypothetical protein